MIRYKENGKYYSAFFCLSYRYVKPLISSLIFTVAGWDPKPYLKDGFLQKRNGAHVCTDRRRLQCHRERTRGGGVALKDLLKDRVQGLGLTVGFMV